MSCSFCGKLLFSVVVVFAIHFEAQATSNTMRWAAQKNSHTSKKLELKDMKTIVEKPGKVTFQSLLDPILIPRVPGTPNHAKVKDFIIGELKKLKWNVESDEFEDKTPVGVTKFENIIATLNPGVPRRLVLACHYDSKLIDSFTFIGATDSAVSCAMLIHLAYSLNDSLEAHKLKPVHNVTLQFIFFDGEEAFLGKARLAGGSITVRANSFGYGYDWTNKDSLYGSRHLAVKWAETPYPPGQNEFTELDRMDMMLLLDLIGGKSPNFGDFFQSTSHWHNQLLDIENVLRQNSLFIGESTANYFLTRKISFIVEDDHVPFLNLGVNILHMICLPFPSFWHLEGDNKSALDFPTIENLNRVLKIFVTSYLHLPVS